MGTRRSRRIKSIRVLLAAFVLLVCCTSQLQPSFAASKTSAPGRPVIKSASVKGNTVTVKWSKAKRATKYKIYVRKGPNKWKYLKKVKKNSANKKKYSNKINYKIVSSGKKYKVYKRANPFKLKATVKKLTYSFKGEYGTRYSFIVKPYAGKKAGTRSKIKTVKVPEKKTKPKPEPGPDPDPDPEPEAMNINGEGMEDMIWSWWYYPQVISDSSTGKVFWGYATKEGYCGVAEYDSTTNAVTKNALKKAEEIDDHNGLALTLLDDKRIMCAYAGGHNTNKEIHVRISDKPLDISKFSKDLVLESQWVTCYSQIIRSSGKYWLFYRVNNNMWAYRTSVDGQEWSDETVAVKADMQYYCRFMPTTDSGLIRIVMYSNPSNSAPEIRQGFLNPSDGSILNADAKEILGKSEVFYDRFSVLIEAPSGKTQRLFDVAVSAADRPLILYTVFSKKKGANDSVYYLYDTGISREICAGGAPLMDYKYQLGAAFINENSIVSARNNAGCDHIELYNYNNDVVSFGREIDNQPGSASCRDARPIADVNGSAVLWHNGRYNKDKYTDFDTSARMYLIDKDEIIADAKVAPDAEALSNADQTNINTVKSYAARLFNENMTADRDYLKGGFTWDQEYALKKEANPEAGTRGWLYFNGLMMEAFLTANPSYSEEIMRFFDSHINSDGEQMVSDKARFPVGALDNVMPAAVMVRLVNEGFTDDERTEKYNKAVNYIYNKLEHQIIYDGKDGRPSAGRLWLHHQVKDSETGEYVPASAWAEWNICLDGIYMSQLYLIRLAEAIDSGKMTITANDGHTVTSQELWDDIYTRMVFVMKNMRISKTGLLAHVYSPEKKTTNEISWGRGMGWFAMVMLEAAEKMPDEAKRQTLQSYYDRLMRSALEWQDPESLLWYNVMTRKSDLANNRPETSGSAMISYCLLRGYKDGILKDEEFRKAGLTAFNSMVKYHYSETEGLADTLISMGPADTEAAYQNPRYVTNEAKGIAPLIMASEYVNP